MRMNDFLSDRESGMFPAFSSARLVFLEFHGAKTRYDGELLQIGNVVVRPSGLDEGRIRFLVNALNRRFAGRNVRFCAERPRDAECSTVFVGRSDIFAEYGSFLGLAERIGGGRNANAFVFMDRTCEDAAIVSVIAHEVGHLLGETHAVATGELADYAAVFYENDVYNDLKVGADSFGTISSNFTYNGNIGPVGAFINSGDCDWFSFTAGVTGSVTLKINAAQAEIYSYLNGVSRYCYSNQPLTLNVTRGTTYYFTVSSRNAAVYGYSYSVTGTFSGGGGGGGGGGEGGGGTSYPADLTFYRNPGWTSGVVVHQAAGQSATVLTSAEKTYLDVCIQNNGKGAAGSTYAYVYIDGVYDTSFSVIALSSQYYTSKTNLDLGILSAGKHKITVRIDPNGAVTESNVRNNILSKTVTVKDATPPGKVGSVGSRQENYDVVLSWSAVSDNVKVGKYQISWWNAGGTVSKTASSSKTAYTIRKLAPGTYYFTVTAIDSSKNYGQSSSVCQITVRDVTAPGVVSVKSKVTGNTVDLSWKAPKDNVGVAGYILKYGASLENTVNLSADRTAYQFTGVAQGTFQYQIFAVDAAGNVGGASVKKAVVKTPPITALVASSAETENFASAVPAAESVVAFRCDGTPSLDIPVSGRLAADGIPYAEDRSFDLPAPGVCTGGNSLSACAAALQPGNRQEEAVKGFLAS